MIFQKIEMKKQIIQKLEQILTIVIEKDIVSHNFLGGDLGALLFIYHYYLYSKNKELIFIIQNKLLKLIESEIDSNFSFCSGLAGFSWLINYLKKGGLIDGSINSFLKETDSYLNISMKHFIKDGNYDYLHGAGGIAWYFLYRIPNNNSTKNLKEFIDELYFLHKKDDGNGIKWESILDIKSGKKGYNISLSHGMASIIVILSKLYQKKIETEKTFKLLQGAVNYLLQQKLCSNKYISIYPNFAIESIKKLHSSRLAWCYGDLGIGISLWHAFQATNNILWKNEALETLLHSAKRKDLNENMLKDAGLCHGTSGIAHIFNRMYYNTKILEFKKAGDYWVSQTLKMAKFDDGYAGFKAWRTKESGGSQPQIGILEGISGIGLSLLSSIYKNRLEWDECLLLS